MSLVTDRIPFVMYQKSTTTTIITITIIITIIHPVYTKDLTSVVASCKTSDSFPSLTYKTSVTTNVLPGSITDSYLDVPTYIVMSRYLCMTHQM